MDPEQDHESKTRMALRKAAANALERKRRLGQYAVIWRDGQMVRLSPEQPGSPGEYASEASAPPSAVREPGPDDEGPK
ncbi:hypothetical protein TVD_06080 [Thioalkalivibrio versutus]|uniref:Uncharacterized protein n=1 Tax=Thioalkalivibrio versutus TaxID=106634 RepID=A0A0G3G607_9GAMM|nr:hypothetical protein [Thioalkalivibrio versutus]AKJ94952.1 hypothetical protein TVD_06080 [Thioalkalivibrio versutus]